MKLRSSSGARALLADGAEGLEREVRGLPWDEQDRRIAAILRRLAGVHEAAAPPQRRKRDRTKRARPPRSFPIEGTLIEGLLSQQGISELAIYAALILPPVRWGARRAEDLGLPVADALHTLEQSEQLGKVRASQARRNTASGPQLIKTWALVPWS